MHPCITERLLMGRTESNQSNQTALPAAGCCDKYQNIMCWLVYQTVPGLAEICISLTITFASSSPLPNLIQP